MSDCTQRASPATCIITPQREPERLHGCRRVLVTLTLDRQGRPGVQGRPDWEVTVAYGCLIAPAHGDYVEALIDRPHHLIVTNVITRQQENAPLVIGGERRAKIALSAGEIEIQGSRAVTLRTSRLSLLTQASHWVSDTLQQISRHLVIRSQHASRQIARSDITRAQHIVQDAQQSYVMNSEIASLNASAVMKVDGSQIHVG